jgi:hypothetical protein
VPQAGSVRVEHCGSHWKRTPGDRWMLAAEAWTAGGPPSGDNLDMQLLSMFVLFNTITVRDGIDPKKAHKAFLVIDAHRQTVSADIPS